MKVKCIRVVSDHDYPFYTSSGFAHITQHISYRVFTERVLVLAALSSVLIDIWYTFAFGTELF